MAANAKLQPSLPLQERSSKPPALETELDKTRDYERRAELLHEFIRDAVAEVGHKEVAFLLDLDPSTLSNLINCRDLGNGKRQQPPARIVLVLGAVQKSGRLAAHLNREWGFAPPVRATELTPEEENRRLKAELRAAGTVGQHLLERALGSGR